MNTLFALRHTLAIQRKQNISARAVALATGIPPTSYNRYERGAAIPNALEARSLAQFFNLTVEAMIQAIDATVHPPSDDAAA